MAILHDIYRVPDQWQDATNCYWTKGMDTTSGKRVFIKEYKNLRYRNNPDASPLYRRINDRLDAYCRKTLRIMSEVNRIAGSGGDVVVSSDFFREGVMIYKVTELVDKVDWKPEDVHRHLTVRQIDDLMLRLTNAISALHSANILHCDLKPENVFIVEREGRYIGMVSDFDDSFFLDDIPAPDQVVGTPEYFSPELGYYKSPDRRPEMTARLPLTPASDMFSLGLIYHKYLTGEDPKIDEKHRGQVWNALFEEGGSYTLGGGLDAAHCALIRRLLYCYPSGRIANCTELAAEINKIRNARTTYALRAMIGDAPARNRTLALYGEIPCGEGGQKVLECLQNVRTDEKGVALLTGLPAEQKLKLRKGDGYEDIEWDADHAYTFHMAPDAAPAADRHYLRVLCDGAPLSGQEVELFRVEDGQWKPIGQGTSNARGLIPIARLGPGQYGVACCGAKKLVKWDEDNTFTIALRQYVVTVTRNGAPVPGGEVALSILGKAGPVRVLAHRTDGSGRLRFRFPESGLRWQAACGSARMEFAWPESGAVTLALPCGVEILCRATLASSTTPVEGVKFALLRREGDRPRTLAEAVTDPGGEAALGRFEPGEYYLAAISAPEGIEPSGGAFRQGARVVVPEGHEKFRLRMEFTRRFIPPEPEHIVADRQVPPGRGGRYVRVIHYNDGKVIIVQENGSYRCLRSAGELGLYELSGF